MGTKPSYVVLTGADDRTDADGMRALSRRYPVEWGILLSPKRAGEGRYPSRGAVERLCREPGLRLSAHLCGDYARSVCEDGTSEALKGLPHGSFARLQINVSQTPADLSKPARFATANGAARAILQWRNATFPVDDAVDWLYDTSGGRGETPAAWPSPVPRRPGISEIGYAGGIGPANVTGILADINARNLLALPYFIDMESSLRTDDVFDLEKCEAVLRAVYP